MKTKWRKEYIENRLTFQQNKVETKDILVNPIKYLKLGFLFSKKALVPSIKSSVPKQLPKEFISTSYPFKLELIPAFIDLMAADIAFGEFLAIWLHSDFRGPLFLKLLENSFWKHSNLEWL